MSIIGSLGGGVHFDHIRAVTDPPIPFKTVANGGGATLDAGQSQATLSGAGATPAAPTALPAQSTQALPPPLLSGETGSALIATQAQIQQAATPSPASDTQTVDAFLAQTDPVNPGPSQVAQAVAHHLPHHGPRHAFEPPQGNGDATG